MAYTTGKTAKFQYFDRTMPFHLCPLRYLKRPPGHRHNWYKKGWYDQKNRILAGQAGSISIVHVHVYRRQIIAGC